MVIVYVERGFAHVKKPARGLAPGPSMNGLNQLRKRMYQIARSQGGNRPGLRAIRPMVQKLSPGTRTQPSIRMRALRLITARVTRHWPPSSTASAPTRSVPDG